MKQTKEDILISEAYNKVYEDTHSHQHINNRQNNINDEERSATAFGTKEVTTNKMDAHLHRKKKEAEQDEITNMHAESLCEINATLFPMDVNTLEKEANDWGVKMERVSKPGKPSGNRDVASYYQVKFIGPQGDLDSFVENLHQQYGSKGFEQIA